MMPSTKMHTAPSLSSATPWPRERIEVGARDLVTPGINIMLARAMAIELVSPAAREHSCSHTLPHLLFELLHNALEPGVIEALPALIDGDAQAVVDRLELLAAGGADALPSLEARLIT